MFLAKKYRTGLACGISTLAISPMCTSGKEQADSSLLSVIQVVSALQTLGIKDADMIASAVQRFNVKPLEHEKDSDIKVTPCFQSAERLDHNMTCFIYIGVLSL